MRRLPPTSDEPWAPRETHSPPQDSEVRRLLSEEGEQEALAVLREQFRHEQRITSDDVRFVVRSIASQNGSLALPPDFPPTRWILDFKRAYGFAQLGGGFAFGLPERIQASRSSSIARVTGSSSNSSSNRNGSSDDEQDHDNLGRRYSAEEPDGFSRYALRPSYDSDSQLQMQHIRRQQHQHQLQLQHQRRSMIVDDHRAAAARQSERGRDREELGSNSSNNSMDSESGTTTGASSSSSVGVGAAPSNNNHNSTKQHDAQDDSPAANEKRGYKLSHTVPPETWEKAIAAVEQQGMSLRAAAKIYGVHFAALHRRVKKRAQGGQSSKGNGGYFHPSDEAGIMRVVVARAELGVLMTFDELMKLVETAALRKLPDISVDAARKLMVRFQSRNEQSIRHIIVDWPPPLPAVTTPSGTSQQQHYHLEHPGFDYEEPSDGHLQRSFGPPRSSGLTGGAATAAAVAAAPPSLFQPPSRVGPFSPGNRPALPSMKPMGDALPTPPSLPQQRLVAAGARAVRDKDCGRAPVMFV